MTMTQLDDATINALHDLKSKGYTIEQILEALDGLKKLELARTNKSVLEEK